MSFTLPLHTDNPLTSTRIESYIRSVVKTSRDHWLHTTTLLYTKLYKKSRPGLILSLLVILTWANTSQSYQSAYLILYIYIYNIITPQLYCTNGYPNTFKPKY